VARRNDSVLKGARADGQRTEEMGVVGHDYLSPVVDPSPFLPPILRLRR
jgi:hypothetical protein